MKRNVILRGVWVLAFVAAVGCGVDDSDQEVAAQAIHGRCHAGATCVAANPCQTGTISCATHVPVCVAGANVPAGTSCGINLVCNGSGTCAACTAGVACAPSNPCHAGVISCTTGAPVCIDSANRPAGTTCAIGKVCDGAGNCT